MKRKKRKTVSFDLGISLFIISVVLTIVFSVSVFLGNNQNQFKQYKRGYTDGMQFIYDFAHAGFPKEWMVDDFVNNRIAADFSKKEINK